MIQGVWSIYKRELRFFFQSASTYVVLGLLFLICGTIFHQVTFEFVNDSAMAQAGGPFGTADKAPNINVAVIEQIFRLISAMILFIVPILTMRLIASERSGGMFEVLVTCPIDDWSIILGKYLALVTVGCVIVALCSIYPIGLWVVGRDQGAVPDLGIVLSACAGLLLIFAAYGAFGLMASAATQSQVTAAIVTLVGLMMWAAISEFHMPNAAIQRVTDELSAAHHTENFITGFVSLRDLSFYFIASFACLFVSARVLEARRWKV